MHFLRCGLLALTAALLFLLLPIPAIRGNNLLEADAPDQSKTSTNQTEKTAAVGPPTVKQSGGKEVETPATRDAEFRSLDSRPTEYRRQAILPQRSS